MHIKRLKCKATLKNLTIKAIRIDISNTFVIFNTEIFIFILLFISLFFSLLNVNIIKTITIINSLNKLDIAPPYTPKSLIKTGTKKIPIAKVNKLDNIKLFLSCKEVKYPPNTEDTPINKIDHIMISKREALIKYFEPKNIDIICLLKATAPKQTGIRNV